MFQGRQLKDRKPSGTTPRNRIQGPALFGTHLPAMVTVHMRRNPRKLFNAALVVSFLVVSGYILLLHRAPEDDPLQSDAEMGRQRHFRFLRTAARARCSPYGQQLVVYVHSAPTNYKRRLMIRRTWGTSDELGGSGASLVFLMGQPGSLLVQATIDTEVRKYGDILQADFLDSYRNLTLKAVAGLKWVSENCSKARYVLKTDDDILADIFQLSSYLSTRVDPVTRGNGVMLCNLWSGNYTRVERDPLSKWRVTPEEYPYDHYPVFCQGAAYVLSADVARALYRQSLRTPYFRLDDVYVTGILREQLELGTMPLNDAYFTGAQKLSQLSVNRTVKPLFFEVHSKQTYYELWSHIKNKKCCPAIKPEKHTSKTM